MTLRNKAISGAKWTTISKIVVTVAALVKISVLARFLESDAFGLMALVSFVLGFMNLFMDMGLTSAILHRQNITKKEYASLYWINVVFSVLLFLLIVLISPVIATFYEEQLLNVLIPIMASSLIINAVGRQFRTIEQKQLNFKFLTVTDIAGAVLGMVSGILFAINGYGVFSLVYSALIQYAVANGMYLVKGLRKHGLLWHYNFRDTKPFLKIGMYQVGGQVVNYFNRDIDILLIGKFFGSDILGGYSLAKQLVSRPMSILNPILTSVASPVLSMIQKDKTNLKNKYLSFVNLISTANFTAYALLAILAYPTVYVLYGEDFLDIVTIVQILSAYMYLRSISSPVGSLLIATGRTDYDFYWNLLVLFLMPPLVFIASFYQIEAIAVSLVVLMFILTLLCWKLIITRLITVSLKKYLTVIVPNFARVLVIFNEEFRKKN